MTTEPKQMAEPLAGPRSALSLAYADGLGEQIVADVLAGFEDIEHGPSEVIGVLFGTWNRNRLDVQAMRRLSGAQGGSRTDEELHGEIERTLNLHKTQLPLRGLVPVGWFVSHIRDSLVLRPLDKEIFDRYFPEDWQVTVVMRPGPAGTMRAAVYARNRSETELTMSNLLKLDLSRSSAGESPGENEPPAQVPEPVPAPPETPRAMAVLSAVAPAQAVSPAKPLLGPPPVTVSVPVMPAPAPPPQPERRSKWKTAILIAFPVLLAAAAVMAYISLTSAGAPGKRAVQNLFSMLSSGGASGNSEGLQVNEKDGVLQIEWDGGLPEMARAASGRLEITDGAEKRTYELTAAEVRKGAFAMVRKSTDVTAHLIVLDSAGHAKEEIARYLGKPVVVTTDPHLALIDEMQKEIQDLRSQLKKEQDRANELQSWADVLESTMKKREGRQ